MAADIRSTRLRNFFSAIIDDKRGIRTSADAKLFLSAICAQQDRIQCISILLSRKHALQAVHKSFCMDLSDEFLNGLGAQCVEYFAHEDIRHLNGGQLLRDLLQTILTPALLWDGFKDAAAKHRLSENGLRAFARLLLELLMVLPPISELHTELSLKANARWILENYRLLQSPVAELRSLGYGIQAALNRHATAEPHSHDLVSKPGGRHDNDFEDFRKVAIFPTTDEILAEEQPFFRTADSILSVDPQERAAIHIDNQFRLLREDMLAELREDLKRAATTPAKFKKRSLRLQIMQFSGVRTGDSPRYKSAVIALRSLDPWFHTMPKDEDARKKFIADNKDFIKHGSFGSLMVGKDVVAFATVDRDEDLLARDPPVILLRVFGHTAIRTALMALKTRKPHEINFLMIDTPFFAYEPILNRLQTMLSLPMAESLLSLVEDASSTRSPLGLEALAARITRLEGLDLKSTLRLSQETRLDKSQTLSFVAGLTQPVSLIQGPPGTGKSFIGALLAKAFLDRTNETILVLSYTNHAKDQFIEDILDLGVLGTDIVRLGSKFTVRTRCLGLLEQRGGRTRQEPYISRLRRSHFEEMDESSKQLNDRSRAFIHWKCSDKDVLEALEFAEEDLQFWEAFSVPKTEDGMIMVGNSGKAIDPGYLLNRWKQGRDAGVFQATVGSEHPDVWNLSSAERTHRYVKWINDATSEQVDLLSDSIRRYNNDHLRWEQMRDENVVEIMKSKRIIACTTTAAAKYARQITGAKPGIVMVEEAGEVLESHVLTAMSPYTKQLVLIGDHLQLRPKVNNYSLTVEKGDGFDLNRSLFERLVVGGYPHTVLTQQHRMRPQISVLVKRFMYPDLCDSDSTLARPDIRGLQSNVIFIDHEEPETSDDKIKDRQDSGTNVSRQNQHEVKLVLKIVRYLAQQGYGTDKQVVLTPYLGQLRLLINDLKAEHDPILSDLDSHDLVKAGLLSPATANHNKRQLRVSTIDNFQGEESDIVIVSLTRSNKKGDIGFLNAPQRLNVLLSRARNGLIIIGNANTFRNSKKGSATWVPFFTQLISAGQFFDGLPVRCQQHPDRKATLKIPKDFETHCPSGGCELPCRTTLRCGKHKCPESCHQLVDHSKMQCKQIEESQCPQGHKVMWECWKGSNACSTCDRLAKEQEARQKRDLKLTQDREEKERVYREKLQALDDAISDQRRLLKERNDHADRVRVLEQKHADLIQAKIVAQQKRQDGTPAGVRKDEKQTPKKAATVNEKPPRNSSAAAQWELQKASENTSNEHIDALMNMVGLESVKQQVLDVKDKIDTSLRQGASLEKERFGVVLLGNPGTGKTTVARLYAKCLASMGAVAGNAVEETTASNLTNGGVPAFKKIVEKVLNAGGGGIFIDEAYQLATGKSAAGSQILDALLDEAENLVGKVVFILAGYKEQMEDVFSHNPGLPSRFPHELLFEDYEDHELLQIFQKRMEEQYNGQMKVEDGYDGLFCRIVARRVGYGRGRPGFANARAVENIFAKIRARQAARISKARRNGQLLNDFLMTKEDLIGPEPSSALERSKAWGNLKSLIGLSTVKQSVEALMTSVRYNYERELKETARLDFNLNRVFLGSPGTGKTTVAKLYGQILADLGLLSNGQVVVKNPSDFVGDALGVSEKNTRGILASTVGKVLVIDEAYGLSSGSSTLAQSEDPYKTAVIDTLVAQVQSVPGEDRCVLLLGYKDQMETMMQRVNPGLSRRFPLSEAFIFEDFSDDELERIVELKLKQQAFTVTDQAKKTVMEMLSRARNKPNFGNAGEVDILFNAAKMRHQKRQNNSGSAHNAVLEAVDIDPEFDRAQAASSSVRSLFKDTVGNEGVIARLEKLQKTAGNMRSLDVNPRDHIPFNFIFAGPPGTGKTTTARKMGKIYYDMGILGSEEVVEISATDLVGQFVGQTGPKAQQQLQKALGKVLFVDEAYRLAEGAFSKEAVDELVDRLTKPEFAQRLIVILAGYDHDMERLMDANSGLRSRFPEWIAFHSLRPKDCLPLLISKLTQQPFLDVSDLTLPNKAFLEDATARFETLIKLGDWANARDVETLAKCIARERLFDSDSTSRQSLVVTEKDVLNALADMLKEREKRVENLHKTMAGKLPSDPPWTQQLQDPQMRNLDAPKPIKTAQNIVQESDDTAESVEVSTENSAECRDVGVSDEVWARLESDKRQAAEKDQHYQGLIARQQNLEKEQATAMLDSTSEYGAADEELGEDVEGRRRLEEERIAHEIAQRQKQEEWERLQRERAELERERQREQKAQQKLRAMGVCPVGYQWIKQSGGYRCAGGSHYVSDAALENST